MGYTHYFRGFLNLSEALVADIHKIVAFSDIPIRGWDGTGVPELGDTLVSLNGDEDDGEDGETFVLRGYDPESTAARNGVNNDFCKTGHRKYDKVVCTILLRASTYNRRFRVSSDGDWESEEWVTARKFYENLFGEAPEKPKEM